MAYNAELQMLREVVRYFLIDEVCYFCEKPFLNPAEVAVLTFGHRRHGKVHVEMTLHHLKKDRTLNRPVDLALCHTACHKKHHKEEQNAVQKGRTEQVQVA